MIVTAAAERELILGVLSAYGTGPAAVQVQARWLVEADLGILAPCVEVVTDYGMIGIAMTTSEALVHPFSGRTAMIGTNPRAIAVPARPHPLVLDMATGEVSTGRILRHAKAGQPIPVGCALDAAGEPTTDPAAAVARSISPFGGAKGSGLGLALEVLVATLTATALGRDVHGTLDAERVCNKGDVFLVADPSVLSDGSRQEAVSAYLDAVRAMPVQEGVAAVRVPGDWARAERTRGQQAGVEIPDAVWHEALALARRLPGFSDGRPAQRNLVPTRGVKVSCGLKRSGNGIHGDGTQAGSRSIPLPDGPAYCRRGRAQPGRSGRPLPLHHR